ncbi:MAG: DUF6088 family protein [Saprospiraceae bacterium]
MRLKTLESKVRYRISRSKDNVFLPKDFADLGQRDQVSRVLRSLIGTGDVLKIGYGLYAKATYSRIFNKTQPVASLPELAREALNKLGVQTGPTYFEKLYNERKSTQVPTGRVIGVKERVSRKIGYGASEIIYERIPQ